MPSTSGSTRSGARHDRSPWPAPKRRTRRGPAQNPSAAVLRKTPSILSSLDMTQAGGEGKAARELERSRAGLNRLQRKARRAACRRSSCSRAGDAAGKGGAIRRVTAAARREGYQVIPSRHPPTRSGLTTTSGVLASPLAGWASDDLRPAAGTGGAGRACRGGFATERSGCEPTPRSTSSKTSWRPTASCS